MMTSGVDDCAMDRDCAGLRSPLPPPPPIHPHKTPHISEQELFTEEGSLVIRSSSASFCFYLSLSCSFFFLSFSYLFLSAPSPRTVSVSSCQLLHPSLCLVPYDFSLFFFSRLFHFHPPFPHPVPANFLSRPSTSLSPSSTPSSPPPPSSTSLPHHPHTPPLPPPIIHLPHRDGGIGHVAAAATVSSLPYSCKLG